MEFTMEFTAEDDVMKEIQVMHSTCSVLCEVFGFSMARAREAVNAISDKSDVELAWNWLLDHGEEDGGGPVVPTQMCYHVQELSMLDPWRIEAEMAANHCVEGCVSHQNWLCLSCGSSRCSRYNSSHNIAHYKSTGHSVALSLSDLSVWCYSCNKYVKSTCLEPTLALAAYYKHRETEFPAGTKEGGPLQYSKTAVCFDGRGTERHRPERKTGVFALERPERTQKAIDLLSERNILSRCVAVRPVAPTVDLLQTVHSSRYLSLLQATKTGSADAAKAFVEHGGSMHREWTGAEGFESLEADMYVNTHSYDAAVACAGAAVGACHAVCTGQATNGFGFTRPPGHHACRDHSGGFCLLNNAAIAAQYALGSKDFLVNRVLIVDWDIHHGNGIQDIFYEDPNLLYVSVHSQEPQPGVFFHDDGGISKCGAGKGTGFNVNVALGFQEEGFGDGDYDYIFANVVLPLANEFAPDLIIVAAGFDSCVGDPLGRNTVTPQWFGKATKLLQGVSSSAGRVLLLLEGGYDHLQTANCIDNCLQSLLCYPAASSTDRSDEDAPSEVGGVVRGTVEKVKAVQGAYWSTFCNT